MDFVRMEDHGRRDLLPATVEAERFLPTEPWGSVMALSVWVSGIEALGAQRVSASLIEPPSSSDNGPVFEIVLHQPQIPPNTGNIIRLCANTGARLHLVEPLGFEMSDAKLRRAGLDYRDLAHVEIHESWPALRASMAGGAGSWYSLSTSGRTTYSDARFRAGDVLVFGCEQDGLPPTVLAEFDANHALRVPMVPGSRSLNLANTVAVVALEAWRQIDFRGSVDASGLS